MSDAAPPANKAPNPDDDEQRAIMAAMDPDRARALYDFETILHDIKEDPQGMISLGPDGVLRSWTPDRAVVDAVGLTPRLVKAYLDVLPYVAEEEARFRGVDGTKTPREQWYDPPAECRLPPLPEEYRTSDPVVLEGYRRLTRERDEEWRANRPGWCTLHVVSDYKIL